MKSVLKMVLDESLEYQALVVACDGCTEFGSSGLHMLPVGGDTGKKPRWEWNGNLELPTLTPSVRSCTGPEMKGMCHFYLIDGIFRYLSDSTHSLAGSEVALPDLPDWALSD